jgi:pantoate--beta-alanine ligase
MILFKRAGDLSGWLQGQRSQGKSIGFVPTMGALHAGHISLIDISKKSTGITVCSIFVNPTQFNDPKDFQKYPITIEKDIYLLEKAGTDVLFLPEVDDLYPGGTANLEKYELGKLETLLEGKYRPGHFQGVCQVMRRLLDIVVPDDLFMGQKDYQQCMVVRRLLELRKYSTRLHPCPIVRETDGLAMSSRNMRLTATERAKAPAIYRALSLIQEAWENVVVARSGDGGPDAGSGSQKEVLEGLLLQARAILEEKGFRVDYVEVADAVTLEPIGVEEERSGSRSAGGEALGETGDGSRSEAGDGQKAVALVAAFLGEIRLIDNRLLR